MSKRIGIGKKGRIDSAGRIKIGSIFSLMRELPEQSDFTEGTQDLSLDAFIAAIDAA